MSGGPVADSGKYSPPIVQPLEEEAFAQMAYCPNSEQLGGGARGIGVGGAGDGAMAGARRSCGDGLQNENWVQQSSRCRGDSYLPVLVPVSIATI